MNREDLLHIIADVREGSSAAVDQLCERVEELIRPFDKQTYMREYMREYRRGVRRRIPSPLSSEAPSP